MTFSATIVVAGCLALMTTLVSGGLQSRFQHRAEVISQQHAILHRQPMIFDGEPGDLPGFRNRLLFPVLLETSAKTGLASVQKWFIAWRIITAAIMFIVFLRAAAHGHWHWSVLGSAVLAYMLVLSFNHPWEHPTDFLDVTFTVGFCALTLAGRWIPLLLLALLAATNRESAAFAGLIWACVRGRTTAGGLNIPEIARGAAVSLVAYAGVLALRHIFAVSLAPHGQALTFLELPGRLHVQTVAILELPGFLAQFLRRPTPYGWPILLVASIAPVILLAKSVAGGLDMTERGLLLASAVMFCATVLFGMADEIRVFLPSLATALYALVISGSRNRAVS